MPDSILMDMKLGDIGFLQAGPFCGSIVIKDFDERDWPITIYGRFGPCDRYGERATHPVVILKERT